MLRKISKTTQIIAILLSSILLSLSFPNFNLSLLAYIAFVPLFFALKKGTYKEAFFLSYVCGLIFFGITIFWVHHVSILGYIILISILSIFFALFGPFFLYAIRYTLSAILLIPASWVVLEYIRGTLFTGFGWALLGHSQYLNLPIIQISDITGAYGVSFLVMMVNVIIYSLLSNGFKRNAPSFITGLLIICTALGYGYFRLGRTNFTQETLNISLIQGNIPQHMKWDPQHKDHVLDRYSSLTKDAKKDRPGLVIWPETAIPGFLEEEDLLKKVKALAKDANAYLLAGAPSLDNTEEESVYNSAVLISKEGDIINRYNKLHLVPFGEYIPLGLDFLRNFIDKPIGDFKKGDEYTIFKLEDGARFGVLVCFEDIFPSLVRNFVKKGADFMVNITNDAWFMKTSAPYQHAQSSIFRAVENRIPVVRAANTGFSCFIDGYGKIIDAVNVGGESIFIAGHKTRKINLSSHGSFYSKFGDIFTYLCMLALVINGTWKWVKGHL